MLTIEHVRRYAIDMMPYAARALLAMQPVASDYPIPGGISADVSWNLYYNPTTLEKIDHGGGEHRDLAVRTCLECVRLLQKHAARLQRFVPDAESGQSYGQFICGLASTLTAAELLEVSGLPINQTAGIARRCQLPPAIEGHLGHGFASAEHTARVLFFHLPPPQPPKPEEGSTEGDSDGQQEGQGNQAGQHKPSDMGEIDDVRRQLSSKAGTAGTQRSTSSTGSSADGIPRPWEQAPAPAPRPRPGQATTSNESTYQQAARKATAQAILAQKSIGDDPGRCWIEWAEQELTNVEINKPQSFQSLLRQYAGTRRGYDLRRYDGRNRRQQQISDLNGMQFVLPSDCSPRADVMFILDTSGSMCVRDSLVALKWIADVLRIMQLDRHSCLWSGDTTPHLVLPHITREAVSSFCPNNNGGTNMPQVITQALKLHLQQPGASAPNLIVCVTDGYTGWDFREPLTIPLVIALSNCSRGNEHDSFPVEEYARSILSNHPIPDWAHLALVEAKPDMVAEQAVFF